MKYLNEALNWFNGLGDPQKVLAGVVAVLVVAILLVIFWPQKPKAAKVAPIKVEKKEPEQVVLTFRAGQLVKMQRIVEGNPKGAIYTFRVNNSGAVEYALDSGGFAQLTFQQLAWNVEPRRLEFSDNGFGVWSVTFFKEEWRYGIKKNEAAKTQTVPAAVVPDHKRVTMQVANPFVLNPGEKPEDYFGKK